MATTKRKEPELTPAEVRKLKAEMAKKFANKPIRMDSEVTVRAVTKSAARRGAK